MKRPPPLTVAELQEMNRAATMKTERRLLRGFTDCARSFCRRMNWDILLTDDRILYRNVQIAKVARALRAMLENEPLVLEEQEKHDIRKLRKWMKF